MCVVYVTGTANLQFAHTIDNGRTTIILYIPVDKGRAQERGYPLIDRK